MAEKRPLCIYSGNVEELNAGDTLPGAGGDVAAAIDAADGKATLHDNDKLGVVDTEASNVLKSHTWANIKSGIKTYLDGLTNWVSNAMLRNSAAYSLIGRDTSSAGVPADIAAGSDNSVLMRVDAGGGSKLQFSKVFADQIWDQGVHTANIKDENVTYAKLQHMTAQSLLARADNVAGEPADVAIAEERLLGRITGGNVAALTSAQVLTMLGVSASPTITRKTADQAWTSDTTLANVNDMSFSAAASKKYLVEFILAVSNVDKDSGIRFSITGPASPTSVMYMVKTRGLLPVTGVTAFGSTLACSMGNTGSYDLMVVACVLVNGSTAGTVQLQASQNSSKGTATTIHLNSVMRITEIP